jgi:DNA topoisomerase-2
MAFVDKTNKVLKKAASSKGTAAPKPIVDDDDDDIFAHKENDDMSEAAEQKGKSPKKKKTVEETYQKLTQLEHVLLRPDTYIGSTEMNRTKLWVYDADVGLNQRDVTYVPGPLSPPTACRIVCFPMFMFLPCTCR